ncbi:MAG TPA: translocation/assembly module TamB domain-containing protein [Candidatus Acidoferrales bacterium]|nr:translocation/assembly module TamB domain-containing protein [Candidatus Acidoferrales bacterium]
MRRFQVILAGIVAALVVIVAVAYFARNAVGKGIVEAFVRSYGYRISFERFDLGLRDARLANIRVQNLAGEPVLSADRVYLRYSLADFVRGKRRFGLENATIVRPYVTLVHHADGTYNVKPISLPRGPQKQQAPLWMRFKLQDGTVAIVDDYSTAPKSRREELVGINADADLAPDRRSSYNARLAIDVGGRRYPVSGYAIFDDPQGFESQHWTAVDVPVAQLLDFAIPTHQVSVLSGALHGIDFRMFSLKDRDGKFHAHVAGHATLEDANISAASLRQPLRGAHGDLLIGDDSIAMPRLDATLAGIPVAGAGGIYDFSDPQLRFGVTIAAPLERLRTITAQIANRPISGKIAVTVLAEGHAVNPLVLAAFSSPSIHYANLGVSHARGLVAMQGSDVDVIDAGLHYGPLDVGARGTITLDKRVSTELVASVTGPSDRLPYVAHIVPHMPLRGVAVVSGVDRALRFDGVVDGANRTQRLTAIASVNPNGTGTAGPVTIDGPSGESLYARVALDRPSNENAVFVSAHHFVIKPGSNPTLPGIPSKPFPSLNGTLTTHAVALQHGNGLEYLGGDAAVTSAHANGVDIDRALALGDYVRGTMRLSVLADARVDRTKVAGHADLAYSGDRLQIVQSAVSLGGGIGLANGTVTGLGTKHPSYDVNAEMREADVALLTKAAGLHLPYPEGSIDADARVRGSGNNPSIAGNVSIPAASINGLAFSGDTRFSGTAAHIVTTGGKVVVGSTRLHFAANVGAAHKTLVVTSNAVNLADFNDYFDTAETLAGKGAINATLDQTSGGVVSSGHVTMSGMRFRRFALGNANARWNTTGDEIAANGTVIGTGGSVNLNATARVNGNDPYVNASARIRNVDLATWLPAAGINVPVLGHVDADASAKGPIRTVTMSANATLHNGIVDRVPVQRFVVSATASNGRGRIVNSELEIPNMVASASGTFGFAESSPVDITLHATSPDVGALATTVTHKKVPYHGAVATTLHATGSFTDPRLDDVADLSKFTYNTFVLPSAHTEVIAYGKTIEIRNGSVTFEKGSAVFAANLPLTTTIDPPVSGYVDARSIDLTQFATLLPKGTKLGGMLAGNITLGGTNVAPLFGGTLGLTNASYSSPIEATPLTHGTAKLAFSGTRATLSDARFTVGKKGALEANGTFDVPDLRDPAHDASFNVALSATRAAFNLPKYFSGQLDGTLSAAKQPNAMPQIAGSFTVSHTRIPAAAVIAQALAKRSSGKPPALGLNMKLALGQDVRVQGAGVDVGAAGSIAVGGTLADPKVTGTIDSTGGTINMYRDFTLEHAVVAFNGQSIIPNVDATATTMLTQPETDVRLHVSGPATHLTTTLTSNPPYDQAQIIALMIGGPSLAGINGLQTANGPQPPSFLQGAGEGYVNGLFAQNLLEPLQGSLGTALGLQNVQFNYDIAGQGGFSAQVKKGIGNNMSLFFATTYGFPSRTTFGADEAINKNSSVRFSLFSTYGEEGFGYYPAYLAAQPGSNISLQAQQPLAGQQGFSLNYVRHFK